MSRKNANGAGNIRKRSDGRWEARYSIGYDPKTGKLIQKSVYGKTQKEVRQKLAKITSEIDEGTYIEPNSIKLSEWLTVWLRDYIGNVKPATVKSYTDHVKLNIIPYIGKTQLGKLSPAMIQTMYNTLQHEKGFSLPYLQKPHHISWQSHYDA